MTTLIHLADRVLNCPLLITRDKAQVILSVLGDRLGVNPVHDASRFEGRDEWDYRAGQLKPYRINGHGVGIITITGSLVARGAYVGASSGLTSYEGIQHQLKSAATDSAVKTAIIDIHSPGGEAVLAFETAALVRELSSVKRTIAVVNGMAASAAYAIASGATEIVTAETGVSGSIGVVLLHADYSRKLDREGITPTLIHAGAHKVDGNPFEPLTDEIQNDLQAEVDAFYEAFLSTVAKGRGGRLSIAAARKTEARTFIGKSAVAAGVADRVGSFESAVAELSRAGGRKPVQNRRTSMDTNDNPVSANAGISTADHERAVGAARSAGATAERERFKAVIGGEQYKGREAAAHRMLFETDMEADVICGVLETLPAAKAESAPSITAVKIDGRGPLGLSIVGGTDLPSGINTSQIYHARKSAQTASPDSPQSRSADPADVYARRRETTEVQ